MVSEDRKDMDQAEFPILWMGNASQAKIVDILDSIPGREDYMAFRLIPLGAFKAINDVPKKDILSGNEIIWEVPKDYIMIINHDPSNMRYWSWVDYHKKLTPITNYLKCYSCGKKQESIFQIIKDKNEIILSQRKRIFELKQELLYQNVFSNIYKELMEIKDKVSRIPSSINIKGETFR